MTSENPQTAAQHDQMGDMQKFEDRLSQLRHEYRRFPIEDFKVDTLNLPKLVPQYLKFVETYNSIEVELSTIWDRILKLDAITERSGVRRVVVMSDNIDEIRAIRRQIAERLRKWFADLPGRPQETLRSHHKEGLGSKVSPMPLQELNPNKPRNKRQSPKRQHVTRLYSIPELAVATQGPSTEKENIPPQTPPLETELTKTQLDEIVEAVNRTYIKLTDFQKVYEKHFLTSPIDVQVEILEPVLPDSPSTREKVEEWQKQVGEIRSPQPHYPQWRLDALLDKIQESQKLTEEFEKRVLEWWTSLRNERKAIFRESHLFQSFEILSHRDTTRENVSSSDSTSQKKQA
jgi:hypothetical protein